MYEDPNTQNYTSRYLVMEATVRFADDHSSYGIEEHAEHFEVPVDLRMSDLSGAISVRRLGHVGKLSGVLLTTFDM
jgi:hypothetical protein